MNHFTDWLYGFGIIGTVLLIICAIVFFLLLPPLCMEYSLEYFIPLSTGDPIGSINVSKVVCVVAWFPVITPFAYIGAASAFIHKCYINKDTRMDLDSN